MIFVAAANEPTMVLMLTEKDVLNMRGGRTVFVDKRQTGGYKFDRVVISLHKTDKEALDVVRRSGHGASIPEQFTAPEPTKGEGRCEACNGCIAEPLLFEGKCTQCWAELAKKLQTQRN